MRTVHQIHLFVLLIPEHGGWVAQALQHDFAAQGATHESALNNLAHTIGSHILVARRHGIGDPLAEVPPAPPEFWESWERAAMRSMQATELEAPSMPPAFVIQAVADSESHVHH